MGHFLQEKNIGPFVKKNILKKAYYTALQTDIYLNKQAQCIVHDWEYKVDLWHRVAVPARQVTWAGGPVRQT